VLINSTVCLSGPHFTGPLDYCMARCYQHETCHTEVSYPSSAHNYTTQHQSPLYIEPKDGNHETHIAAANLAAEIISFLLSKPDLFLGSGGLSHDGIAPSVHTWIYINLILFSTFLNISHSRHSVLLRLTKSMIIYSDYDVIC
jgi:hypothetical protein